MAAPGEGPLPAADLAASGADVQARFSHLIGAPGPQTGDLDEPSRPPLPVNELHQARHPVDGKLMTFNQGGTKTTTVAVPPVWDGPPAVGTNHGAAGILFGAEGNRGNIGGQRARNLVVSTVKSLAGLPVQSNLP